MNNVIAAQRHSLRPAIRPGLVVTPTTTRGVGATLRRAWNDLVEGLVRRYRAARAQAEIDALDDATLRDVGLSRSEAASYWAESERLVDQTRLRLLARLHASP